MRRHGWAGRLHRYLAEARHKPFEYGTHDCALFASGAAEAITGGDPAFEYRGRYTTLAKGIALLRRNGLMDHVDLFRALFEEIRPLETVMGDVLVVEDAAGPALGVAQGAGMIFVLTLEGMQMVPTTDPRVMTAFRIE